MSNQPQPAPKKLTAAQRLEQNEGAILSMFHTMNAMANDLIRFRGDVGTLENKVNATIGLINSNLPLTNDNIAAVMTKNNVDALAAVVKQYVDAGILSVEEEVPGLVGEGFVVLKEMTPDGKIISHRRQLLLAEMDLAIAEKLMGQKVGSTVVLGEQMNSVEILEAYKLVPKKQDEQAPANA